jgi:hypothetical protein
VPNDLSPRSGLGALIRYTRRLWAAPDLSRREPLLAARIGGGL